MTSALDGIADTKLKSEIVSLVQYMNRFREEIAQIVRNDNDQTHFEGMADQLDAIIAATEDATNTILETVEDIDNSVDKMREAASDPEKVASLCDEINDKTVQAMEACTFQDITGQRVTKIVRSMQFVEERVNALADLWGRDEILGLADELQAEKDQENQEMTDEDLLNGPALPQETSISQADIDALFD